VSALTWDLTSRFSHGPPEADAARDAELAAAARRGDPSALSEIVRRHQKRVYNLAYRMLRNPEDAEDITQDAFLSALAHLSQIRRDASLGAWICRIAANLCLARIRSSGRAREVPLEASLSSLADAETGDEWSRRHLVGETREAIARLPPKYRLAVVACYLEGRSYQEAARIAGVPVRTLKTRLYRARAMLRRLLQPVLEAEETARR